MGTEITVLVVDEDEEMLDLTETFIERESDTISVQTENHPPTAADRVVSEEFDCVVSDLRMPDMDGIELCQQVHGEQPTIPFFLFTAADDEEIRPEREETDLTGVIRKGTGTDHYTELAREIEAAVKN